MDTANEARDVQLGLLRKASVAERVARVQSLTRTTLGLSWRGLEKANPDATPDELKIMFISLNYGQDLGDRVRTYLARRAR